MNIPNKCRWPHDECGVEETAVPVMQMEVYVAGSLPIRKQTIHQAIVFPLCEHHRGGFSLERHLGHVSQEFGMSNLELITSTTLRMGYILTGAENIAIVWLETAEVSRQFASMAPVPLGKRVP